MRRLVEPLHINFLREAEMAETVSLLVTWFCPQGISSVIGSCDMLVVITFASEIDCLGREERGHSRAAEAGPGVEEEGGSN